MQYGRAFLPEIQQLVESRDFKGLREALLHDMAKQALAAGQVHAGNQAVAARREVRGQRQGMRVANEFAGHPAGGWTGPASRNAIGLRRQPSICSQQVHEDVVRLVGARLGAPRREHAAGRHAGLLRRHGHRRPDRPHPGPHGQP